jgi:hypothetical protein
MYPQVDIELELIDRCVDIVHEGWDAGYPLGELNTQASQRALLRAID